MNIGLMMFINRIVPIQIANGIREFPAFGVRIGTECVEESLPDPCRIFVYGFVIVAVLWRSAYQHLSDVLSACALKIVCECLPEFFLCDAFLLENQPVQGGQ